MTDDRSSGRAVAAVSGSLSVGVLPIFLLGALSDRIGDDLGFGARGTGAVVAVSFAAAGLCAIPLGVVSDRIGAQRSVRLGVVVSATAAGTIGLWVGSLWQLAITMAVAGSVVGLIDTGSARLLSDLVRRERQGVAFGIKEASVPAASMIAGVSIPLVAERFGWRPLFAIGVLVAPLIWMLIPASEPDRGAGDDQITSASRGRPLIVLAIGAALAVGAATAAATFLVPATKAAGLSSGGAGVLLAAASAVAISTRIAFGMVSDRRPDSTTATVVGAMVLGAIGAGLLAVDAGTGLVVAGSILVLGAGWGWTGLAFLAAVRAAPDTPSTAAGVVLTGLAAGGVGGPAVYGFVVSAASYQAAWVVVAAAMVAGAAFCARSGLQ